MVRAQDRPTWLTSERLLARTIARPLARFLAIEAAGGLVLVAATIVALAWANSPAGDGYRTLWHTEVAFRIGEHTVTEDLRHWVNDGLMALFFFVVGLEIKQEIVDGHLSRWREAALPVVAAVGGMVVPAAIFLAFNAGGAGSGGWGIPMATDIAFALGVVALLGSRVPPVLKVILLALAIVDDIGAIVIIAIAYTDDLDLRWALAAAAGLALVVALRRARVWYLPIYVVIGVSTWFCTLESGIHATIAGVALGLLTPARPLIHGVDADRIAGELSADTEVSAEEVRDISFRLRESVPVSVRLQELLHPWTGFVVIPVFALANAGIELSGQTLRDAASSPVSLGVAVGLVAGKVVGVAGAILLGARLRLVHLPAELSRRHVLGLGAVAGIGFTVSLFITDLAFARESLVEESKIGVLVASMVAAAVGLVLLARAGDGTAADETA